MEGKIWSKSDVDKLTKSARNENFPVSDGDGKMSCPQHHTQRYFFFSIQSRILLIFAPEKVTQTKRDGRWKVNDLFLYLWSHQGLPSWHKTVCYFGNVVPWWRLNSSWFCSPAWKPLRSHWLFLYLNEDILLQEIDFWLEVSNDFIIFACILGLQVSVSSITIINEGNYCMCK